MKPEDLVSMGEIADAADVSKSTVIKWRERFEDFPAPVVTLAVGPIWNWKDVERWLTKTGRLS